MSERKYPSDLKDNEWAILAPLLPPALDRASQARMQATQRGHAPGSERHLLCVEKLKSGCQWRMLPKDFPHWKTVYHYFNTRRRTGMWQTLNSSLRERVRSNLKRERTPSGASIDSQSVKTTAKGG